MKLNFIQNIIIKNKKDFNLNSNVYFKIFIGLITIIIISLFLPSYKSIDSNFEIGTIWSNEDLIAPFSFPIYRDEIEYEQEKKEAKKSVAPVFIEIQTDPNEIKDSINNFFTKFENVFIASLSIDKNDEGVINSDKIMQIKANTELNLTNEVWILLFKFYKNTLNIPNLISYQNYKLYIKQYIKDFNNYKIINIDKSKIPTREVTVKKESEKLQRSESIDNVYDKNQLNNIIINKYKSLFRDTNLINVAKEIIKFHLKENYLYSKELTELEIQSKTDQIPKTIGIVKENERIISKHDPINNFTKLKLDSYKKVRLENMGVQDYFSQYLGKLLTIIILLTILSIFLFYIRNDIFRNNRKLILISSLIILECLIAFISLRLRINYPVELLIFLSVASILLTIIFDSRLSFFTTVITCFLVAAIRGGDYTVAFIAFSGSVLSIFSVRDIKNRSQIFISFFFILLGYSLSILAISFERSEVTSKVLTNLLFGGINSIMSPVIAYGLLIFYEKVFRITTDLTLLELADFNQPLLKELSTKAPGTFHHSIVMGNLAEEAAASIGANRILARVGCYYHDIGKVLKPDFFVENQIDKINRHESLNPSMSAKIIISHVKNGIELARKFKIPQDIIDFIPMHHGTTLISYFYSKAKHSVDVDKEDISDYIYRYPGPKPQTKETGIAMLADTVEASTKAIEEPTAKKLEDKIDEVIKKRFIEGELDECDLTLKDLTKIKKSFLKILVGIHHQRIKYPEDNKEL